jgi:hypothetical protein
MTDQEVNPTVRGSILKQAKNLTEGERDAVYGDCRRNLQNIANMWNGYVNNLVSTDLAWSGNLFTASDVSKKATQLPTPTWKHLSLLGAYGGL